MKKPLVLIDAPEPRRKLKKGKGYVKKINKAAPKREAQAQRGKHPSVAERVRSDHARGRPKPAAVQAAPQAPPVQSAGVRPGIRHLLTQESHILRNPQPQAPVARHNGRALEPDLAAVKAWRKGHPTLKISEASRAFKVGCAISLNKFLKLWKGAA